MLTQETKPLVLVVDDSEIDLEVISMVCSALGCSVDLAPGGQEALELYKEKAYDLVLTDYEMEPMNGMHVVSKIKEIKADARCLIVTGFPNGALRQFAVEGGVFDIITKPIQATELKEALRLALNFSKGATEKVTGIALTNRMDDCWPLVGDYPSIQRLREQVAASIESQKPLLLSGPQGTGKRELVKFIHENGPNAANKMVEVPCDAIEENNLHDGSIAESSQWRALLSQADGGTLVLDQIVKLPLAIQQDLASHFDQIASKMHIIALSNDSLDEAFDQGLIDDRFYFKVTMDEIHMPAEDSV